jgi:hypothetical protein
MLAAMPAAEAEAVGDGDVAALRNQPCPPEYLLAGFDQKVPAEEIPQARQNSRFKISGRYVKLEPPINWHMNPVKSQTFRNALVAMNWTQVLFKAYHGNDQGALAQARGVFFDFVRRQPKNGRNTVTGAWGSKRVGDRGAMLAYLIRASSCDGELPNAKAKRMLESLVVHGRTMMNHAAPNNHGLVDAMSLAILATQMPFLNQAPEWRSEARRRFERILRKRIIGQEGFWLEHSSGYHFDITSLLERFLEMPGVSDPGLQALLGRMLNVAGWLIEPDERQVQFGDSNLSRPDDPFQQQAGNDNGLFALKRSGIAFVKGAGSYLATMTSFFNDTHKHSDELTFDLFDDGHRIVSDTGQYHKDRDRWYAFTRSARAHSTLTVDGQAFGRSRRHTYGGGVIAAGQGDGWYAIESRNPILAKRSDVNVRRWLVFKPDVALFVVDRVRAKSGHRYERFFHLGPDIGIAPQGGFVALSASGFAGRLRNEGTRPAGLHTVRGDNKPLAGWTSPGFREKVARWTVSYRGRGRDEDYVTTIGLDNVLDLRASLDGPVSANEVDLDLQSTLQQTNLKLTADGGSITISETP